MFYRTGSLQILGKTTQEDWKRLIVESSVRQDPSGVADEKVLPVNLDTDKFAFYRARAVSALEVHGANQNGDGFPESELVANYKTFIRRGIYLNHDSDDIQKAVGIIVSAVWHPQLKYVECLFALDKESPIYKQVESGIATDVSMGALVTSCECSACGQTAYTEQDYCNCLANYLGKEKNGKKVYAINKGVNFYELSIVNIGADSDAHILQRVASKVQTLGDMLKAGQGEHAADDVTFVTAAASAAKKGATMTDATVLKKAQAALVQDPPTGLAPATAAKASAVKDFVKAALTLLADGEVPATPPAAAVPEVKVASPVPCPKCGKPMTNGECPCMAAAPAAKPAAVNANLEVTKENTPMPELTIKHYAGATPETSFLVARKGNMRTAVSIASLTAVKKEAAGKVDESHQEKPDATLTDGGKNQPSDVVKNLGGVDKSKQEKPDDTLKDGGDSAQPADLVKKFAELAEGSISVLARLWNAKIAYLSGAPKKAEAGLEKKAEIGGKGHWAVEDGNRERLDLKKAREEKWAREDKEKPGKPGGSSGTEIKKYYSKYDTKSLAEGTDGKWAREEAVKKMAALETELATVKADLAKEKGRQDMIAKAGLINAIIEMEKAAGYLVATAEAALEIEETEGVSKDDAVSRAASKATQARVNKLNGFTPEALAELKDTLNRAAAKAAPEARTVTAGFVPSVYSDETAGRSPEEILSANW